MAEYDDLFKMLAELLQSVNAQPAVSTDRLAPSAFYDVQYRTALIASAIKINGKNRPSGQLGIPAARLKLLQFIASRPWLLSAVREWSKNSGNTQVSILPSQRIRRGFIGDTTHDRVVEFLVAGGVLTRAGKYILPGEKGQLLEGVFSTVAELQLFSAERQVLEAMKSVKITENMLEGW